MFSSFSRNDNLSLVSHSLVLQPKDSDLMDATSGEVKMPLKLLVDREKNKVLLAEAGSDFIDTLVSFLTLPMGTIVRILRDHPDLHPTALGSFRKLYESVENLEVKHLESEECKDMLLNPRNASERQCKKLKLNIADIKPTKYFVCKDWKCTKQWALLSTYSTARCNCGKLMDTAISLKSDANTAEDKGGGFVSQTVSFIVSDDLHISPNMPSSIYDTLKRFGIEDFKTVEEITINVGSKEIVNLLNSSLQSNSPFTDVFLSKTSNVTVSNVMKSELVQSAESQKRAFTTPISIKLVVQKSSNTVLFAEADEKFVDFLFSLLTIPLGGAVRITSGDTGLGSIGNLYSAVSDIGRYLKSEEMLLNPQLAPFYYLKNQILKFPVAKAPQYYWCVNLNELKYHGYLIDCYRPPCIQTQIIDPEFLVEFTKQPGMFMVTDELVVSPSSFMSSVSLFSRLKVPPSDIEDQVISIGEEEALKILKASLKSSSVLTNAFSNFLPK